MSNALRKSSALEFLQHQSCSANSVSDADVQRAILVDIESGTEVNEVLLTKFVRQAKVGESILRDLIRSLQVRIITHIETDPGQVLNYTKAQMVLAHELRRKAHSFALALQS